MFTWSSQFSISNNLTALQKALIFSISEKKNEFRCDLMCLNCRFWKSTLKRFKLNLLVVCQLELKTFASDELVLCCLAFYKLIQLVWMIIFMLVPVFLFRLPFDKICTWILIKSYVYFNNQSFKYGFYWYWCGFFGEVYKSYCHNISWKKGKENCFVPSQWYKICNHVTVPRKKLAYCLIIRVRLRLHPWCKQTLCSGFKRAGINFVKCDLSMGSVTCYENLVIY